MIVRSSLRYAPHSGRASRGGGLAPLAARGSPKRRNAPKRRAAHKLVRARTGAVVSNLFYSAVLDTGRWGCPARGGGCQGPGVKGGRGDSASSLRYTYTTYGRRRDSTRGASHTRFRAPLRLIVTKNAVRDGWLIVGCLMAPHARGRSGRACGGCSCHDIFSRADAWLALPGPKDPSAAPSQRGGCVRPAARGARALEGGTDCRARARSGRVLLRARVLHARGGGVPCSKAGCRWLGTESGAQWRSTPGADTYGDGAWWQTVRNARARARRCASHARERARRAPTPTARLPRVVGARPRPGTDKARPPGVRQTKA